MGLLSGIKQAVGKYFLNRKISTTAREKRVVPVSEAKSIGIVYLVTDQTVFNKVKLLMRQYANPYRQIMAIGFVDSDGIPDYCVSANAGYFFDRKELNWYGAPANDYVREFINKKFDILIDLTLEDNFVLQYITGLSKAKFKVGRYDENLKRYYDLMIKCQENVSIDELIKQIMHYLEIIKSK